MHKGKKIVAIITARGGSKGLPGKNIRPLLGKPLIAWTIEAGRGTRYVDRAIVSTDSPEIAEVSRAWGGDVPFLRPAALAADDSPSSATIIHALDWLEREAGEKYDYFVMLQPTSPLRTSAHLDAAFARFFADPGAGALVSVTPAEKSPYWMKVVGGDGYLRELIPAVRQITRRQDLPEVFSLNGAIYIVGSAPYREHRSFTPERTAHFVMDRRSSVDIDTEEDFLIAELLMDRYGGKGP